MFGIGTWDSKFKLKKYIVKLLTEIRIKSEKLGFFLSIVNRAGHLRYFFIIMLFDASSSLKVPNPC